ncbi:hypothetical protein HanRHA438_Chr03g0119671 [Helianthus annuus]|nr:hypothetical protein HanPSC8_Chr17g0786541 [Helianthus annuus]KAJ0935445.1 hypothetical protein HanRHA438_Chr03g0119671 [Helianthus annuus]
MIQKLNSPTLNTCTEVDDWCFKFKKMRTGLNDLFGIVGNNGCFSSPKTTNSNCHLFIVKININK